MPLAEVDSHKGIQFILQWYPLWVRVNPTVCVFMYSISMCVSVFLCVCVFQSQFTPNEVVQWSNHRVMEWLRSVDLAEYAPNLRGSGVHGGLIVSTHTHTHTRCSEGLMDSRVLNHLKNHIIYTASCLISNVISISAIIYSLHYHVISVSGYIILPNTTPRILHLSLLSQILEPRFNSDTLAMLLNIPPQKTLLRRHLATNFSNLVGAQAQQEKREYMEAPGYTPLSTTAKVKVRNKKCTP